MVGGEKDMKEKERRDETKAGSAGKIPLDEES